MSTRRPYDIPKRVLDLLLASIGLIVCAPIVIVVGIVIAVRLGRPVFFRQERPGRGGRIFELVKFRSMLPVDPEAGLVDDADRLPPFGRLLRSTSLDELPTLWNVVRGDMSLVGPRPLHVVYLERYTPRQARRHEVRPGITGLAQVFGRNALGWGPRLALDVDYVERRSFALDAAIIVRTFGTVLKRDGISEAGSATMSEFRGAADVDPPPVLPKIARERPR